MSRTATRRTTAHKPTAKATNIPKDQVMAGNSSDDYSCIQHTDSIFSLLSSWTLRYWGRSIYVNDSQQ